MSINIEDYPFSIHPLTKEEGGGFLIEFSDLPGCVSDGETIKDAINNGFDAVQCWISAAKEAGREIPLPRLKESQSGKWLQRAPKSIHARLISRAKEEETSLNTLVLSYISEGLGKHNVKSSTIRHSKISTNKKSSIVETSRGGMVLRTRGGSGKKRGRGKQGSERARA